MLVALTLMLAVGVALTAIGLRGRSTDDHTLCRRCRFDLTGRPGDAERRCPECGAELARPAVSGRALDSPMHLLGQVAQGLQDCRDRLDHGCQR